MIKFASSSQEGKDSALSVNAYEKELKFYDTLRDEVDLIMHCPEIMWQHQTDKTSFCIAMEDLALKYNRFNGQDGLTKGQIILLIERISSMHAHFFNSKAIENDWLNLKDPETGKNLPLMCDSWMQLYLGADRKEMTDKYAVMMKKGADIDFNEDLKELTYLFNNHGEPLRKLIYQKLNSRPKTLVHGNLRPDNIFVHKKNSQ